MRGSIISASALLRRPELLEALSREPEKPCGAALSPCTFIGCRWHLYSDWMKRGGLKLNFPDVPIDQMEKLPATCALACARAEESSIYAIADRLKGTHQLASMIEQRAIARLKDRLLARGIDETPAGGFRRFRFEVRTVDRRVTREKALENAARAAAGRLGISFEKYSKLRAAGKRWCSSCRRWHAEEKFYPKSRSGAPGACREATRRRNDERMRLLRRRKRA